MPNFTSFDSNELSSRAESKKEKFYREFHRYYDTIFPVSEDKVAFLADAFRNLPSGVSVMDIGCGTGGYSIAMAKEGYRVVGIDLEIKMIEKAREKVNTEEIEEIKFKVLDMRDLDVFYSKPRFLGIFSLGNVLVHLQKNQDIKTTLEKFYNILRPEGVIALQIINYDRVLSQNITKLPTLEDKEEGVKFFRNYHHDEENNIINFETILEAPPPEEIKARKIRKYQQRKKKEPEKEEPGEEKTVTYRNSVPLYPLTSSELEELLISTGFGKINFYGGFNKEEFNPEESYSLVVTARKI